eukprot:6464141-Amphidinium_carterae.1
MSQSFTNAACGLRVVDIETPQCLIQEHGSLIFVYIGALICDFASFFCQITLARQHAITWLRGSSKQYGKHSGA